MKTEIFMKTGEWPLNTEKQELIRALYDIGAVKFGSFKLKSGLISPFYIDLRLIVSYPRIVDMIVTRLLAVGQDLDYDCLTGIPYTALPIAAVYSQRSGKPLVYQRKERKSYGTGKSIEGVYSAGQTCLVIDDVMTTGGSKLETAQAFKTAGLKVNDFLIVVDRSLDGGAGIREAGFNVHALITIFDMVELLFADGKISAGQKSAVEQFMREGGGQSPQEKSPVTPNAFAQKLTAKIAARQSNLIVSLDVDNQADFFRILQQVAGEMVMVKTHVDILRDFDSGFVPRLKELAARYDFLIFEDRKFADIGSTVARQFRDGIYRIADWADCITVHPLPGEGILQGLFDGGGFDGGAFLLAAMSARGNLIDAQYTARAIGMGMKHRERVSGYIGFARTETELRDLRGQMPADQLLLMPGVNLDVSGDAQGQQYVSAEQAVRGGADAIIVGRGIIAQADPAAMAGRYRQQAWEARIKLN